MRYTESMDAQYFIMLIAHAHYRYPRLDDQAIFWKVIRSSKNPLVLPIGKCRNFNSADDLASMFKHHGHDHTRYLVSCVLDTCVFSSGMISNVYEPELTYGTYCKHTSSTFAFCCGCESFIVSLFLLVLSIRSNLLVVLVVQNMTLLIAAFFISVLQCVFHFFAYRAILCLPFNCTDTLQANLKKINETICTLHANYLSGNHKKMNRMKEYGFWLATTDAQGHHQEQCLDYVPHVPTLPAPFLAAANH